MYRRSFLAMTAAGLALPGSALAQGSVNYKPGLIEAELSAGKTLLVDYSAFWCSTCQVQARVINGLRSEEPAYDAAITFVKVDWDRFARDPVTTSRRIPSRSTLILLRGEEELGRIVAGTSRRQIKALLDLGL